MDLLSLGAIVLGRDGRDRLAWIRSLAEAAARGKGIDVEQACRDVDARERMGGTLIPVRDRCVAIPHALTSACKQLVLAIGVPARPVPWQDGRADIVFLLLGPRQIHSLYLRALSRLARLCESEGLLDLLTAAPTAEALAGVLAAAEEPLGDLGPVEDMPRFCVVGAAAGGLAMAAHLSLLGCTVSLYDRVGERIVAVRSRGGVEVHGALEGFARLSVATADAAQAVAAADVVMVTVPATDHADVADALAPHLRDGQILVLNPGGVGGTLEVAQVLRRRTIAPRPFIAETQALLYASRITDPGAVRVFTIKSAVPLAAMPAHQTEDVLPVVTKALPHFAPGANVLSTGLENLGVFLNPAIMVLNAARIEDRRAGFESPADGITPAVAAVLETIDRERIAVAAALGIPVRTARELLCPPGGAAGGTLLEALRADPVSAGIAAVSSLQHRCLTEDVPASLVPVASLGLMLGVATPSIRAVVSLASAMHGVDYAASGRTVEKLGVAGLSAADLRLLVLGSDRPMDRA